MTKFCAYRHNKYPNLYLHFTPKYDSTTLQTYHEVQVTEDHREALWVSREYLDYTYMRTVKRLEEKGYSPNLERLELTVPMIVDGVNGKFTFVKWINIYDFELVTFREVEE